MGPSICVCSRNSLCLLLPIEKYVLRTTFVLMLRITQNVSIVSYVFSNIGHNLSNYETIYGLVIIISKALTTRAFV